MFVVVVLEEEEEEEEKEEKEEEKVEEEKEEDAGRAVSVAQEGFFSLFLSASDGGGRPRTWKAFSVARIKQHRNFFMCKS